MTPSIYQFDVPAPATAGTDAVARVAGERPRIGVVRNPRSRHNVEKVSSAAPESGIMLALPANRAAMAPALAEMAREGLDLLVIDGGDGTVRDVLTLGQQVFGDDWPTLAVLPKGKTNALTLDLEVPVEWRLPDALAAFAAGRRAERRPLRVTSLTNREMPSVLGFVFGAGAFTTATKSAQEAHSLGFFNSMAVGMTSAWGVAQALFGRDSNPWRKGSAMRFTLGEERRPAPRTGHGDPAYRCIALATTLARLPMGAKPFGPERHGLKLAIMDLPLRRLLLSFPLLVSGRHPAWFAEAGYRVHDVDSFELEIEAPFIIDGEPFPAGHYRFEYGPRLDFVVP